MILTFNIFSKNTDNGVSVKRELEANKYVLVYQSGDKDPKGKTVPFTNVTSPQMLNPNQMFMSLCNANNQSNSCELIPSKQNMVLDALKVRQQVI